MHDEAARRPDADARASGAQTPSAVRKLYAAEVLSGAGDGIFWVALIASLADEPHFGLLLGFLVLARLGPRAFFSVRAGSVLDRSDVRSVLIGVDLIRAVMMFALAVLVGVGGTPLLMLAVVFVSYVVGVPTRPGLDGRARAPRRRGSSRPRQRDPEQHPTDDDLRRTCHRCADRVLVSRRGRGGQRRVVRGVGGPRGVRTRAMAERRRAAPAHRRHRSAAGRRGRSPRGRSDPLGRRLAGTRDLGRRDVLRARRRDGAVRLRGARHLACGAIGDRLPRRGGGSRGDRRRAARAAGV